MSDDLEYLRARLPGYREYGEEDARHDSDMRVRAFVGERLTDVQTRLAPLDEATQQSVDEVMMRCMFTDQAFIKKFEHAELSEAMIAALLHADRALVECGERLATATAADLGALLASIDQQLDYRRSPSPLAAP